MKFLFIITYRYEAHKGFFIKTEARQGQVIWKVASEQPITSWDIDGERTIVRDSMGRVYMLNTKTGKLKTKKRNA